MTPISVSDPLIDSDDHVPVSEAHDRTLNNLSETSYGQVHSEADAHNAGAESDYGDFEDEEELEIIDVLLSQAASWQEAADTGLVVTDIEDYEAPRGVHLPRILGFEQTTRQWESRDPIQSPTQTALYRDTSHSGTTKLEDGTVISDREQERSISVEPETQPLNAADRSPLHRFRRPPKKALSVTDLISPSWCELQYFYTLTRHGKKRRTPAMKQGTAVHEALEREVHVTVPVEILKKEDSWGLRIWNIVQGLRTLRDTGRTRELEIWGTVGGEIVNGVIDELSYTCPDLKLEAEYDEKSGSMDGNSTLPEYQASITDYLLAAGGRRTGGQSLTDALNSKDEKSASDRNKTTRKEKRIYITDVKTRGSATLPTGASIRPTILQLHLYHHMLENMAQGNFTLDQLTDRYGLDPDETFSDSFIAQIGGLNQDLFEIAFSQPAADDTVRAMQIASSQDSMDILLQNNSLSSLWEFMMSQFRRTFLIPITTEEEPTPTPQSTSELDPPAPLPTRLSPILTAEYLAPTYKHQAGEGKKAIGSKSFVFNPIFLKSYLEDNLAWWRGEREARGVALQEAWKCRSCDFRDDCSWIHERNEAAVAEVNERKKMREIAGVEGPNPSKSKV